MTFNKVRRCFGQPSIPRCFAAVVRCPHYIARVPHRAQRRGGPESSASQVAARRTLLTIFKMESGRSGEVGR
jgi:hypothetical protein